MKQLTITIKKYNENLSYNLFKIGNYTNLAKIKPLTIKNTIFSDQLALKKDWEAVGREVVSALGRFQKEYSLQERK